MRVSRTEASRFLICLLTCLLGACSVVNVAYNNANTVAHWYFDDYFDFSSNQRALFDQGLQRLHVWHRKEELPKYAALCFELARRVEAGLKGADLDWMESAVRERFNVLVIRSVGDLAPAFAGMEPAQLTNMDKKFAKSNAKFIREHLSGTPEQRDSKRISESLTKIEDWVGDLRADQEASVTAMIKLMPQMDEQRQAHRLVRQKALREIFAGKLDRDKLEAALNHWIINWESGRTADHERVWGQWAEQNRNLVMKLIGTLTPQQRTHVINKLRRFADDFTRLNEQEG